MFMTLRSQGDPLSSQMHWSKRWTASFARIDISQFAKCTKKSGSVSCNCVPNFHQIFAIPQNLYTLGIADVNRCPKSSENGCCIDVLGTLRKGWQRVSRPNCYRGWNMDFTQHPHYQTAINGVASFSVAKQATQFQTNCISPKTDGHCFLGPLRGPPCWFHAPQHNHQFWCLLCYTSTYS